MIYFSKWKIVSILVVVVFGLLYSAPNLLDQRTVEDLPGFLPKKQVSLGLDLRGGSHLLLEVKVESVIKDRFNSLLERVRIELRKERVKYKGLGVRKDGVFVSILQMDKLEKVRQLLSNIDKGLEVTVDGGRVSIRLSQANLDEIRIAAVAQSI